MQKQFFAIFYITLFIQLSNAFHVFQASTRAFASQRNRDVSVRMAVPIEPLDDFGDSDGLTDIEAARKKLELLVGDGFIEQQTPLRSNGPSVLEKDETDFSLPTGSEVFVPPPPPLTSIERERRETEIGILKHLLYGDDVLPALWEFWYHERGAKAASLLERAYELSDRRETQIQAESILLELIDEYGVHWVEPVNCLATLYYLQGRLRESEELCLKVLKIKPWHVGALSGIVLVYEGLNASDKACQWAARRLLVAPTGSNRRRQQWVERSVAEAEKALSREEQRLKEFFGAKDAYPSVDNSRDVFFDDVWQ